MTVSILFRLDVYLVAVIAAQIYVFWFNSFSLSRSMYDTWNKYCENKRVQINVDKKQELEL